jgi:3-oxoadipate enol-lactonase
VSEAPLALLHPVGLDRHWFADVEHALAPRLEARAFDLPGHGEAPPVAHATLEGLARVMLTRLPPRFHLAGVSVGGMVAQNICAIAPHRVLSATLIATAATFPEPARAALRARGQTIRQMQRPDPIGQTIDRWFTPAFQAENPEVMAQCAARLAANPPDVIADFWSAIAELDTLKRLPDIACPVSVVVGDRDTATPVEAARLVASLLPNARLHILKGVSHIVQLEAPDALADIILETVARGSLQKGNRNA